MDGCVDGADIYELCQLGENLAHEELKKVYHKNKNLEKGLAFPLCVSVNEICGHYSPFQDESTKIKNGDVVKIDLGIHIDGFIAMGAHTMVVQEPVDDTKVEGEEEKVEDSSKVTGRNADAILAAYNSIQAAYRTMRPGQLNTKVTEKIAEICADFKVSPVQGVLSHELN